MAFIPYGFVQKPSGISVEPGQANIVQQIYQRYLKGESLLSNQKYISYIISFDDFFMVQGEKARRSNIDEDTGKRKATRYSSQNVLSSLLVCAECDANYHHITRPSGDVVWRCANRVEHGKDMQALCITVRSREPSVEAIMAAILSLAFCTRTYAN